MYEIVTTPNSILVEKSKEVKSFDKKLKRILRGMEKTLLATTDPVGVGLAAPQVGIPLRIFQMRPTEKSKVISYINPVIVKSSEEEGIPEFVNSEKVEKKKPEDSKDKLLEGCLSIPAIWGNVSRKKEVTLLWHDEYGKRHEEGFDGFESVIVQHEVDHLNGILFTKHVMDQGEKLYRSYKNAKGEDDFEEIKL